MNIHKIVEIKGIGKYVDFIPSKNFGWDGVLSKNNAIYAENGCGKTTLSQIFKSLSKLVDISELHKRKTFMYSKDSSIKLKLVDSSRLLQYDGRKWSSDLQDDVEVFDSYYIEDNVYVISLSNKIKSDIDFQILLGVDATLYKELEELKRQRNSLNGKRSHYIKTQKESMFSTITTEQIHSKIQDLDKRLGEIRKKIAEKEKEINKRTEESKYLQVINDYLDIFSPNLHITKLNRKSNNVLVYGLKIGDYAIRSNETESKDLSLRKVLSEGEKNSLALSFFLARLRLMDNLKDKLIVFDDPISSMDVSRRQATLNQLNLISSKCSQFILLSHDQLFVRDFSRFRKDTLVLKIGVGKDTNFIVEYNVEHDTSTGVVKDIHILKQYADMCTESSYSPRDVVRCIRPTIEGFLRLKYVMLECFKDKRMLGEIIKLIETASDEPLKRLQKELETLREINEYSKQYHHSNPTCLEVPLSESELRSYCKRTLDLLSRL